MDRWLWPVIFFNAILTSLTIWYLVRFEVRLRTIPTFFAIVAGLAFTTSVSWYASSALTDAFGGLAYLALYFLVFRSSRLTRNELWMFAAIAWWGMVVHTTHLIVCMALCCVLLLLSLTRWQPFATRRRNTLFAGALVVFAIASQVAFHRILYGRATLNGPAPPYLMARIIADGPGTQYLQEHCSTLHWTICKHVGEFPMKEDRFLWGGGDVWQGSSPADQAALRREEMPFLKATLRTYPRQQLQRSLSNFASQLVSIDLRESRVHYPWMNYAIDTAIHGSAVSYSKTMQARGTLPVLLFSALQQAVCLTSAFALAILLSLAWARRQLSLLPLTVTIVISLLINALACGVLSAVSERYQGRIIWLVPALAILLAIDLFQLRQPRPEDRSV